MSDETPDLEPPDATTPQPTSLEPELAEPPPVPGPAFQSWHDDPPSRIGCLLQVLLTVAILVAAGWTTTREVQSGLFRSPAETTTSTSSTSTSTSRSSSTASSSTTTTLAQVEEYSLGLTYAGACEGSAAFFLRVLDGSNVELHLGEPGGESQRMATSTIGPPGRSFAFDDVQGSALTFDGQIDGDTVAGTGSWADFGPGCSFTFAGSRI